MQETIRQHFVPRTYLKHFSTDRGKNYFIGFIPKSNVTIEEYRETNIRDICFEKHLYTLEGATAEERMWAENLYSEMFEKKYDKVYEMLVDDKKNELTQEERHLIISTVISMYYRTTSWNRTFDHISDDIIDRGYHLTIANGKTSFMIDKEEISIVGKTLEQLKTEYREKDKSLIILTQVRHILKLINMRTQADTIMVNKLAGAKHGYITSDNPVICANINQDHIMPIDPTNIFSLPLDPTHHLSILPAHKPEWRHGIYRNTFSEDVSLFPKIASNTKQHENAQQFILGSKEALEGYINDLKLMQNPDEKTQKLFSLVEKINEAL